MSELAQKLTYESLASVVAGKGAAIRVVTRLGPAGGPSDKVFPPTYSGGKYATELRRIEGAEAKTVLLDSVQSQANRMELALRTAWERNRLKLPMLRADFTRHFPAIGVITVLDAPHRIADAIFRDSLLKGTKKTFRESEFGQSFEQARVHNAMPLLELCPTALLFGVWDSTGKAGGLGAKFARAIASEIVGFQAVAGVKTASRIDPLPIAAQVPIYKHLADDWTTDPDVAEKKDGKPVPYGSGEVSKRGKPSSINLGNVTPDVVVNDEDEPVAGGLTIDYALQTTVFSLGALRKLRFPLKGKETPGVDEAARMVLAALGLVAIALQREDGYDLRSRCVLVPSEPTRFEILPPDGLAPSPFALDSNQAIALFNHAVSEAKKLKIQWREDPIELEPQPKLIKLVTKSMELLGTAATE